MGYRRSYNRNFGELGVDVAQRWPERGVIGRKGKQNQTLGLALSGGGYRSAIFNYGVLRGLRKLEVENQLKVLSQVDYLSVVSGGSWIGTAFATSQDLDHFFWDIDTHANFIEEGFESLLINPLHVAQELALGRKDRNYVSNVYGRLIAGTFLRERGQDARWMPLHHHKMIKDEDRPFLIINGTVNFRPPGSFHVLQECFEMTRMYCGSRSLGYVHAKDLKDSGDTDKSIRVRDAIAISGAALAVHIPSVGDEVAGIGLSREVVNYTMDQSERAASTADAKHLDIADGGHYNNLGIESLVNRGCGYIIVVDAEHDVERRDNQRSNQKYHGLRTLLRRHHIQTPFATDTEEVIAKLDKVDEPVHVFSGDDKVPDILYIKLKSDSVFNEQAAKEPYNDPSFLGGLFGATDFHFDPQFSTAKLDYAFAEHRNLSRLGSFMVEQHQDTILDFIAGST